MKLRTTGLLLAFATATAALAQPQTPAAPPAEIRSFALPELERMGREIHRQDQLAWKATDALVAKGVDPAAEKLRGWVVLPGSDRIRFVSEGAGGLEAAYETPSRRVGGPASRRPPSAR